VAYVASARQTVKWKTVCDRLQGVDAVQNEVQHHVLQLHPVANTGWSPMVSRVRSTTPCHRS
jgi:hypothetical protein